MEIVKVTTYYMAPHGLAVVNLVAACPTGELSFVCGAFNIEIDVRLSLQVLLSLPGGVLFAENVISWHIPRRITPLVDGSIEILEMHMGINGVKLDKSEMAARGYKLSATDFHIIIKIPVGSPDGYYKVGKSVD